MFYIAQRKTVQRAINALKGQKGEEGRIAALENLLEVADIRTENAQRKELEARRKARSRALLHNATVFG